MYFGRSVSDAGTGWQGAVENIPHKKIRLVSAEIENANVHDAEGAYIVIAPMIGTPTQIKNHDRNQGLVNGWAADMRHLKWQGNMEIDGACSIAGFVYHNASVTHTLKVLYEILTKEAMLW